MPEIRWMILTVLIALAFIVSSWLANLLCTQRSPSDQGAMHFIFAVGGQITKHGEGSLIVSVLKEGR